MPVPRSVRRRRGRALPALAVFLLAGCTTTVVGTASPAGEATSSGQPTGPSQESVGPLEELVGQLSLNEEFGDDLVGVDMAALPDGGAVLLLRLGEGNEYVLVELPAGGSGLELGTVHEMPSVSPTARMLVADDGTVVVPDFVEDGESRSFGLVVLEPGAEQADVRVLTGLGVDEIPALRPSVLSADGRTLYVGLGWFGLDEAIPARLAVVDVATAEVTSTAELPFGVEGDTVFQSLALRPDGGLTALVLQDLSPEDDPRQFFPVLAQFDADLTMQGDPLKLVDDGETGRTRGLRLTADGTAVASLIGGGEEGLSSRILVVRDGEIAERFELDVTEAPPTEFELDPDDRYVYMAYGDLSGELVFGTLDLTSGEILSPVPLCLAVSPDILFPLLALDADAQGVTVSATCEDNGLVEAFRVG